MEPRRELDQSHQRFAVSMIASPEEYFDAAYRFTQSYYLEEYQKIASVKFDSLTPAKFFEEYIWVVHATGFSAAAVGKFIRRLLSVYQSVEHTSSTRFEDLFDLIRPICNNPAKSRAIHETATLIFKMDRDGGWESYKQQIATDPTTLAELPYIGKVTCHHLARNIGMLGHVKPDLHLVRLSTYWGFKDPEEMIMEMNRSHGLPLGLADLCVWYYASTFGTESYRSGSIR